MTSVKFPFLNKGTVAESRDASDHPRNFLSFHALVQGKLLGGEKLFSPPPSHKDNCGQSLAPAACAGVSSSQVGSAYSSAAQTLLPKVFLGTLVQDPVWPLPASGGPCVPRVAPVSHMGSWI